MYLDFHATPVTYSSGKDGKYAINVRGLEWKQLSRLREIKSNVVGNGSWDLQLYEIKTDIQRIITAIFIVFLDYYGCTPFSSNSGCELSVARVKGKASANDGLWRQKRCNERGEQFPFAFRAVPLSGPMLLTMIYAWPRVLAEIPRFPRGCLFPQGSVALRPVPFAV